MLPVFDSLRDLTFVSLVIRLLLAVFCGTCIGLERSAKNRPAGFRTHILVCLGGSVAAVTGHYMYLGLKLPADITRLSGQVITGLGFIGAGTIIVTKKMTIKGLNTAAGLWTTGIIGLAIGSGFFEGGLLGTALVLTAQTMFPKLRLQDQVRTHFSLEILYDRKDSLDNVMRFCKDQRTYIRNLRIRADSDGPARYTAILELQAGNERKKAALIDQIRIMPGIISAAEL